MCPPITEVMPKADQVWRGGGECVRRSRTEELCHLFVIGIPGVLESNTALTFYR